MNKLAFFMILAGSIISMISAIGFTRFKKNHNKIHAAGLNDVTSAFITLLGIVIASGFSNYSLKILLICILIILNSPISSHILALINDRIKNDRS